MRLTKTQLVLLVVGIVWAGLLVVLALSGYASLWWSFASMVGFIALVVLTARRQDAE